MGLDAYSYSRVQEISTEKMRELVATGDPLGEALCRGYRVAYVVPDFARRAAPLEKDGIYEVLGEEGPKWGSSYSGYSTWRQNLATFVGIKNLLKFWNLCAKMEKSGAVPRGVPFWQLIHFSDCEGTIGSETAAALAQDFETYHDEARAWSTARYGENNSFWRGYQRWRSIFEHAADDGMVEFR